MYINKRKWSESPEATASLQQQCLRCWYLVPRRQKEQTKEECVSFPPPHALFLLIKQFAVLQVPGYQLAPNR